MPKQPLFDFMKEDEEDIQESLNHEEEMDGNMLSVEDKLILGGIFLLNEASMTTLRLFLSQSRVNQYFKSPNLIEKGQLKSLTDRGWLTIGYYHTDRRCCTDKVDFALVLVSIVTYRIPVSATIGNRAQFVIDPTLDDFARKIAIEKSLFLVPVENVRDKPGVGGKILRRLPYTVIVGFAPGGNFVDYVESLQCTNIVSGCFLGYLCGSAKIVHSP